MWGLVTSVAVPAMVHEIERKHKFLAEQRKRMKETLTPEEFEKWEREQLEERRHQDICAAIRATKPDPVPQDDGIGMGKLLIAACIAGSIARD